MTTLSHVVLDGSNHPVSGRKAQVAVYLGGPDSPTPGTFQKVGVVNAISDSHGNLSWDLPRYPGHGTPTYVVTGIEAHPVVVRVPQEIPATTVAISRIAILDELDGPLVDLVTEDELIARLSALPTPAPSGGGGVTAQDHQAVYAFPGGLTMCRYVHVIPNDMGSQEAFTLTGDWPLAPASGDATAVYTVQTQGTARGFHPEGTLPYTGTVGVDGQLTIEVTPATTLSHFEIVFTSGRFSTPLAGQVVEVSAVFTASAGRF